MIFASSICYAVQPEATTVTQVKEQVQRIEIPSHIKGLRIINNNTLRWSDTKPTYDYYAQEQQRTKDIHDTKFESARSKLGRLCYTLSYTAGLGVACVYGLLRYQSIACVQELDKQSHWWNWKSELSLSALADLPEKQLAQELLASMRDRYDKKTVNDVAFIMPLVHFIQDTNNERGFLEHIIKMHEFFKPYGLHHIFACDEQALERVHVYIARIGYIRGLCMRWLSCYAVDVPAVA